MRKEDDAAFGMSGPTTTPCPRSSVPAHGLWQPTPLRGTTQDCRCAARAAVTDTGFGACSASPCPEVLADNAALGLRAPRAPLPAADAHAASTSTATALASSLAPGQAARARQARAISAPAPPPPGASAQAQAVRLGMPPRPSAHPLRSRRARCGAARCGGASRWAAARARAHSAAR